MRNGDLNKSGRPFSRIERLRQRRGRAVTTQRRVPEIPTNTVSSTPPSFTTERHIPAGAAALSLPRLSGALVHDVGIDIEHQPRRLARGQQCLAER